MRKVYIEPFDCSFFVYTNDELEKFKKTYGVVHDGEYGITCGNGVWIGEHKDVVGVCYHEASHIVDWILEQRLRCTQGALESNHEIRAYLLEFVGNKIRKYIVGE